MGFGTELGGPLTVDGAPITPATAAMSQGTVYYLDCENGSDGYRGTNAKKPLKTLAKAESLLSDEKGDKIIWFNDGNTGGSARLTETLTWSNDNNHLWGTSAQLRWSHRSRMTGVAGAVATFTPLMSVTGHGNSFANFSMFHDSATAPISLNVSGNRNSFHNLHIQGMGNATGADTTGGRHLVISGEENCFYNCTIGQDTITRSALNASVELATGCTRVLFKDCFFPTTGDDATQLFLLAGSGGLDRIIEFENCTFYNATESTSTVMTQAFTFHNTAGGMVLLKNCVGIGFTDWAAADNGNVYIDGTAAGVGTDGIAIAVTR